MKREAALIRWLRWGWRSEDGAGRRAVCRVCQTNGAAPCGKEIITGSVSVKHVSTMQKKEGDVDGVGG